jgi:tricorn protease
VTYSKAGDNYYSVPWLYSVKDGRSTAIGDGLTNDQNPVFSADGKYLFFASTRHFAPQIGNFDNEYIFPDGTGLYLYTLAADTESPLKAQSDEETPAPEKKDGEKKAGDDKGAKADKGKEAGKGEEGKEGDAEKTPEVKIDLVGLTGRLVKLPVDPGNYFSLAAGKGKLFYLTVEAGAAGGDDDDGAPRGATLKFYDLEEREEKTVLAGVNGYELSKDGSKILVALGGGGFALIDAAAGQKVEDKLPTESLQSVVDPKAEWKQMFDEAWRLERDFFYDPNMHGVDWKEMHDRYGVLVPYASHRSDLNYLLGELIAELSCSHAYVGGGDYPQVPRVGVGLLGADYEVDPASGRYRFQKIYRESEWNQGVTAPLGAPGINVKEGDYLLRVNGQDLKVPADVFAAFQGTAGRPVSILVNSKPDTAGAKEYLVDPVGNESDLRYTSWVSDNRKKVADATGGRVAYIHVPDTAVRGQVEFSKGFYSQIDRDGLILDGRFNSGGWIPDVMVQRLARKPLSWWARREYKNFRTPTQAMTGPKVCVTNEYAGSGGDALPYYFREWGLGPLVGKRTWGGLVGISRNLPLVDGGVVTIPDFGFFNLKGNWDVENHGVDMDVEVEQWPNLVVEGKDPQLEKAIEIINAQLKQNPPENPTKPKYPVKAGG